MRLDALDPRWRGRVRPDEFGEPANAIAYVRSAKPEYDFSEP